MDSLLATTPQRGTSAAGGAVTEAATPRSHLAVRSLGSGSSGNALLVASAAGTVLVDCGIGIRSLLTGLRASGLGLADLDALLLTHEHADHVRSLAPVVRARIPVVATAGTARAAGVPADLWWPIQPGAEVRVSGVGVAAVAVSHDAAEPCGFHLALDGARITVVTDLGAPNGALGELVAVSDLIVLEANHDEAMLRTGPYPDHLKRRVLSSHGHLSNADCGRLLAESLRGRSAPRTVWLAHLSATNNRPALARHTVAAALAARGAVHAVEPLARHGHHQTWRPGEPVVAPVQSAMTLDWSR